MALNKTGSMLGTNTGKDPSVFPQHAQQDLSGSVSNTGRHVQSNITMQAGEEFSGNVGRDGIAAGRVVVSRVIPRNHENVFGLNRENGNVRYEDLTNILGLRRMNSENSSDMSDFVSIKQSVQEMENGAAENIFNKIQKGDGMMRKAVQEPVGDQSGLAFVSPLHRYEASQSNGFSGSGVIDDFLSGKMKFLCSFGGTILLRPSDGKLRYVGGETHIVSIPKDISWQELMKKTLGICNQPHTIKYQLPGEDLDALISVSSDEDLQNMKEEYHGLERHERSQKLRIFLVPLGESEETSTEVSAVQQSDPDYQYVVAVNGMGDSTRTNIGGQNLTNESSQLGTDLNFTPVVPKTTNASPLEIRDGINALNPDGILNDSLNLQRPLSIPPTPIPVTGSNTGYIQLLGDHSCQGSIESNASYATTHLHPDTFLFLYITVLTVMGVLRSPTKCQSVGIQGIAWAFGGMIFALVYCTAGISGGHINPAVTFGLFLARKLSLTRALFYIVMQVLGAIAGAGVVKGFEGKTRFGALNGGANFVFFG